jgi:Cu(I)/Ag(I) efflux system membrane fusion protein
VGVPLVAALFAWWMAREPAPPASHPSAPGVISNESAGAAAPNADGARAVALTPEQSRRIGVTFAPVTRAAVPHRIRTVGQVTVDETRVSTISPKVDGWVERLYVDFTGRQVRRGEPLLTVYSPMLVSAQEELLLARRLAGAVATGAGDARAGAEDLVASARRRLAYWDIGPAEIDRIERSGQVRRALTLYSTVDGVVIEKAVTAGQRIMAGDALYRVADLRAVWIEGDVYEQDMRALRVDQPATAEVDAFPGQRWTGRIAYVYPTLSPETRTVRVRIAVDNRSLQLKPGMYATLMIEGSRSGASGGRDDLALTVPRGAVLATGERSLVFVRRSDGRLEPREVRLGGTSGDRAEILAGLNEGDTVVASATFLLDAESSLGTAMGGMGDMPGMDLTQPSTTSAPTPAKPSTGHTTHGGH